MNELNIPELSLVVMVGVTGSGKSTFARAHFKPTEVISSDFCRGMVADDENDQSATPAAFELLHYIAGKRLAGGRLTVVDATNVQPEARRELVLLAREHDVLPVAIVLDLPEKLCAERNAGRPDRDFGAHVLRRQRGQLRRGLNHLRREGFRTVHVLRTPEEVDAATITRTRLFSDLKHEVGPFDVIGDVHGCRAELEQLLTELGYTLEYDAAGRPVGARHPDGRRAIFVGDLVDRGPDTPGVLRLVMAMVAAGTAFCVAGNHEVKLLKALRGKSVKRSHGLDASMEQLEGESAEFRAEVDRFIDGLIGHYVLDGGRLVVAHAGLRPAPLAGRAATARTPPRAPLAPSGPLPPPARPSRPRPPRPARRAAAGGRPWPRPLPRIGPGAVPRRRSSSPAPPRVTSTAPHPGRTGSPPAAPAPPPGRQRSSCSDYGTPCYPPVVAGSPQHGARPVKPGQARP